MNLIKHRKKERQLLLLVTVFTSVFVLTWMTPLVADDFNYAFSWATRARVSGFWNMFFSMATHRKTTNGRVFAHGWVTLFMMWPRWAFSLANGVIVTFFFWSFGQTCKRLHIQDRTRSLLFLAAILWVCMPAFGQVFLWLDGAVNYFWGATFAWLVLCRSFIIRNGRIADSVLETALLLPLTFAAGAWSEHISFAMIVILALLILWEWENKRRFPVKKFLLTVTGGYGYLWMMSAPSMLPRQLRLIGLPKPKGIIEMLQTMMVYFGKGIIAALSILALLILLFHVMYRKGLIRKILFYLVWIGMISGACAVLFFAYVSLKKSGLNGMVSSTGLSMALLVMLFSFGLRVALKTQTDRERIAIAVILFVGGMSAMIPFLAAAYRPARGMCAPVAFGALATVLLLGDKKTQIKAKYNKAAGWLVSIVIAVFFVTGIADIVRVYEAASKRNTDIGEALQTDGVLRTAPYPCRTKYSAQYGLLDLQAGEEWPNDIMREYYGLREIIVETVN